VKRLFSKKEEYTYVVVTENSESLQVGGCYTSVHAMGPNDKRVEKDWKFSGGCKRFYLTVILNFY
jgi:hypothetical protein